jgi:hypothetical protein
VVQINVLQNEEMEWIKYASKIKIQNLKRMQWKEKQGMETLWLKSNMKIGNKLCIVFE